MVRHRRRPLNEMLLMPGILVKDRIAQRPETYKMVIDEKGFKEINDAFANGDPQNAAKALGGWATKDPVNSVADVRNNLAISSEWKGDNGKKMYVVEFTVKPGTALREGTVGSMYDGIQKTFLPGGGHQVQFMNSPFTNPQNFIVNPNSIKLIK